MAVYARWFFVARLIITVFLTSIPIADLARADNSIDFERKTFTVARYRGQIFIDGLKVEHPLSQFPQFVSLIEKFDHQKFDNDREFLNWAQKLRGVRTYTFDEVIETDEEGETSREPLVLKPEDQQTDLRDRWISWLELREKERLSQQLETARNQSQTEQTNRYEPYAGSRNSAAEEIVRSLSIISGETSLWEVELRSSQYPNYLVTQGIGFSSSTTLGYGSFFSTGYGIEPSRSFYVRVTGRTSQEASSAASWKHPGYFVGSIRRISN